MHGSSVFLIALFTSILTATGVTYLMQRYHVLTVTAVEAQEVLAPMLVGLSEADVGRAHDEIDELAQPDFRDDAVKSRMPIADDAEAEPARAKIA